MISSYKRKQSQYLQKIESFALNIADRFTISSTNNGCAVTLSDQIKKVMLYATFSCLSIAFLFNMSLQITNIKRHNLTHTLEISTKTMAGEPVIQKETVTGQEKPLENSKANKTDRYNHHIFKASEQYQVDPYLIKAIIMTESSYNPKAISYRGAKGLMQLMPETAREVGVKDCFDPEDNINGGVKYFSKLLSRFSGNVDLALAAYNAGSTKVRKYRGVPPFRATRNYIKKVNRYYLLFKSENQDIPKINEV